MFALGSGLLFIETGNVSIFSVKRGKLWDATPIAYRILKEASDGHEAARIVESWGVKVESELNILLSSEAANFVPEVKPGDSFVKGVFVSASNDGRFHAFNVPIIFAPEKDIPHFTHRSEPITPSPGGGIYVITTTYSPEISELIANQTPRAVQVNKLWIATVKGEPVENREAARLEIYIEAAIDWSKDSEVGGPVDLLALRSDGSLRWHKRKKNCTFEENLYLP